MAHLGNTIVNGVLRVLGGLNADTISSKIVNFQIITGTGTAGQDKGSGVSPRYIPAIWVFNTGSSASDGDTYTIKIPSTGGHASGVYMSVDNGTNYYPVALNNTGRLTTHFPANTYIKVVFEPTGSCTAYARAGADATATVSGGCFRVINYYDANNNARQIPTTTNANYEVLFSNTADNSDRTEAARKSTGLKFNPSTSTLTLYREGTTANNYAPSLQFSVKDTTTGKTYSDAYIRAFQDHGSDATYGTNMVIHSGGGMFIGSGEAPASHYSAKGASYTGEDTFVTADGTLYLQSNGNSIANRAGFLVSTAGALVPIKADASTNNVGSIGTSTNKVANGYFTNINGYTLSDACAKGVDTSISAGTTSANLPTAAAVENFVNNWTEAQTLSEGDTTVTFIGLTSGYAYDLYSETADGSPIQIVNYVVSGTQITYTISAVTAAQVGQSGTGCRVKLKCMY